MRPAELLSIGSARSDARLRRVLCICGDQCEQKQSVVTAKLNLVDLAGSERSALATFGRLTSSL